MNVKLVKILGLTFGILGAVLTFASGAISDKLMENSVLEVVTNLVKQGKIKGIEL